MSTNDDLGNKSSVSTIDIVFILIFLFILIGGVAAWYYSTTIPISKEEIRKEDARLAKHAEEFRTYLKNK